MSSTHKVCLFMLYLTRDEKPQKPLKVSLGMPSSLAMSPVHQCAMSDMMQLGGERCCSWRYAMSGSCSAAQAFMKFKNKFFDWIMSRFSHPSGRPNSTLGKWSSM